MLLEKRRYLSIVGRIKRFGKAPCDLGAILFADQISVIGHHIRWELVFHIFGALAEFE